MLINHLIVFSICAALARASSSSLLLTSSLVSQSPSGITEGIGGGSLRVAPLGSDIDEWLLSGTSGVFVECDEVEECVEAGLVGATPPFELAILDFNL